MTVKYAFHTRVLRSLYAAALIAGTGLAMLAATPANAQTLAGITIDNTATISYSVGTVAVSRDDTVSFVVDRMIDVQVVGGASLDALPGQTNAELLFTVENQGNATQAYDLTAVDFTDFTTSAIEYDVGGGFVLFTGANFPELAPGDTMNVKLVGTVPASPAGATSEADLLATTVEPVGSTYGTDGAVVAETLLPGIGTTDTVFVDALAAGNLAATDVSEDGQHSGATTAVVQGVLVAIGKTVTVITRDPTANCETAVAAAAAEQFAIPGACIEYTITVTNNSGTTAATNVAINDPLPGQITFVAFHANTSADFIDGEAGDAAPLEVGGVVSATEATLVANQSVSLIVRATIN